MDLMQKNDGNGFIVKRDEKGRNNYSDQALTSNTEENILNSNTKKDSTVCHVFTWNFRSNSIFSILESGMTLTVTALEGSCMFTESIPSET